MASRISRHPSEPTSPQRPAHPMGALRGELGRLIDSFFPAAFGRSLFDLDPWHAFGAAAPHGVDALLPSVDVREFADRYEIAAELPGMDERNVRVTIRDGVLNISGEKRDRGEDGAGKAVSERVYGAFARAFQLPADADSEAIGAEFAKGVLTVTVPRREEAPPQGKKVEIKRC